LRRPDHVRQHHGNANYATGDRGVALPFCRFEKENLWLPIGSLSLSFSLFIFF
jgi:hypothetical protein